MFASTTITHIVTGNLVERLGSGLKKLLILFLISLAIKGMQAQQATMAEADVIAKAGKLFEAKNYQEALPLYAQLVSVHSENPEYNYRFGVCTLYGNRVEHRRPIRYLENAAKTMTDNPLLHYHLGIAYYQNLEFANAMKYLNLYLAKLAPNSPERPVILEKVNNCLNGLTLEHVNLIDEIVSTSEFQKDNFHRAYRADELDGMLILKPETFTSPKEKVSGENSFVFISEPRGTLFFSGYENSNSTQLDIFKVQMTESGDWGKPEKISESINSMFDEAYPVLTNFGTTLYFCSKGHNSLGGYDIFRSSYDAETNTFSSPENLGVGINSPFDDILFIPDKTSKFAFFASDRDNLNEAISVFTIRLVDNALGSDQMLANNDLGSKFNVSEPTQMTTGETKVNTLESSDQREEIASIQNDELSPSEKASKLVQEKTVANMMVDSAFLLVAETKSLIRSLTNKRDRANALSERKSETAKNLEVSFEQVVSGLANLINESEFENELQKAIELRDEIFQYRFRSDQANLIAWNIGKQIKIKNAELEIFKQNAGTVQSASVAGNFPETEQHYSEFINHYIISDTLTDYNSLIVSLTNDEIFAKTPATELAFADDLRQGFKTNSLLALTQKKQEPVSSEPIPINIIDNRTKISEENAIIPVKLVEVVEFTESSMMVFNATEETLEIKFIMDAVIAAKQVEPVLFANAFTMAIEEELDINFQTDRVKPCQLVEEVNFKEPENLIAFENEEIEIRYFSDQTQAEELISPVLFNELSYNSAIVEEQLEINYSIDQVIPDNMINPVYFDEMEYSSPLAFDELEINYSVDQVDAIQLVEIVAFNAGIQTLEINEALEINHSIDATEALNLIEPIFYSNLTSPIVVDEHELEITSEINFVQPTDIIDQIRFNEEVIALNIDDIPELNFDIDQVETLPMIEQIAFHDNSEILIEENDLDIRLEIQAEILPLVKPVHIAQNGIQEIVDEVSLEIDFSNDGKETTRLVQPVYATYSSTNQDLDFETLEINIENESRVIEQVLAVSYENPSEFFIDVTETELEIKFNVDEVTQIQRIAQPIYATFSTALLPQDEELEIRFTNDIQESIPAIALVQSVSYQDKPVDLIELLENELVINFNVDKSGESLLTDNTPNRLETNKINQIPVIKNELIYMRQSMSIATAIETSRTDIEILNTALNTPVDLSYEELLFAAGLAQDPNDKLAIYHQAFIHINRDWRAFNNAAVTAMNNNDLEMAEVFLYQASLVSENNGKIENNMGILACYKNDLKQAESHFLAANEMGVNSEYNLHLMKNLSAADKSTTAELKQEMGESRYYEVLGDIIDFGTKK